MEQCKDEFIKPEKVELSEEVNRQCTTDYVQQCKDKFMEAEGVKVSTQNTIR